LTQLASSELDLQHALDRFATAWCDRAGMKIGTKKTELLSFQQPWAVYAVSGNTLQQVEKSPARFIALWSPNGGFQTSQSCQFLN